MATLLRRSANVHTCFYPHEIDDRQFEFEIQYHIYPSERQTRDYPGCPEHVECSAISVVSDGEILSPLEAEALIEAFNERLTDDQDLQRNVDRTCLEHAEERIEAARP